jgi:hypothetical protein
VAALTGIVAHGGTAGAIVEATVGLAVVALFVAVWLRERRRGAARDAEEGRLRDGE